MITVEKAENYRCCNKCNSNSDVRKIMIRYEGTNSGTQIVLCDKCMRDLVNKIIGCLHEQEGN